MLPVRRRLWRLACAVLAIFALPAVALAVLFVVESVTWRGTLAGLAGLVAFAGVGVSAMSRARHHDQQAIVLWATAFAMVFGLWAASPDRPDPRQQQRQRVRSVWLDPPATSSPLWWIPEIDVLSVGAVAAGVVDPLITSVRARVLQEMLIADQQALEQDSDLAGVQGGLAAALRKGAVHRYEILPTPPIAAAATVDVADGAAAVERRPGAIVFLHGSVGNFQRYLMFWKRIADDNHMMVMLPSYGLGNWHRGGAPAIEQARQAALAAGADPDRIVLAGLSNGGRGVTRALVEHPERWAGVMLLSAVAEPSVLSPEPGSSLSSWTCAGKPALVLHGGADDRVPLAMADAAAQALTEHGCAVTRHVDDARDHFSVLSHAADARDVVTAWLRPLSASR